GGGGGGGGGWGGGGGVGGWGGSVESGRPGGDRSRAARWLVVDRDRGPARQGHLHGVAGGRRQRRPAGVPGLAGAGAGAAARQAAQTVQIGPCQAGGPGERMAAGVVVAAGDYVPAASAHVPYKSRAIQDQV